MSPRGQFTLDETSNRPIVFLSAGVGITPLVSMLEQLASETSGCGCERRVWFIHGATNSRVHAFGKQLRSLEADWPCLNVHVRYSKPLGDDIKGKGYDSSGHIDIEFLKSLLPLDDYEFYLCGPTPFMESMYVGLNSLSVPDHRIHYEFFGAGTILGQPRPDEVNSLAVDLGQREPVAVKFARSGIDATWDPARGTLLDLAESEGLRPVYSCRSGICQTCSTRLVSGKVDYTEPPMTPPGDGETLICCAYPRPGKEIVLDL